MLESEGTFLTVKEFVDIVESHVSIREKDIQDCDGNVCETVDIVEVDFDGMKTIFENLILINEIQKSQKNKKSSLLYCASFYSISYKGEKMKFRFSKRCKAPDSFRVSAIMGKYDIESKDIVERFEGGISHRRLTSGNIGVIYGIQALGKLQSLARFSKKNLSSDSSTRLPALSMISAQIFRPTKSRKLSTLWALQPRKVG